MKQGIYGAGEGGFALVAVMVSMLLLIVAGVTTVLTTTAERDTAAADKFYKEGFNTADSHAEVALNLLEENLNCLGTFNTPGLVVEGIQVTNAALCYNSAPVDPATPLVEVTDATDNSGRQAFYPANFATGEAHTNFYFSYLGFGLAGGSSMLQHMAYHGIGVSSGAAGSTQLFYDIQSQHIGEGGRTENVIRIHYLHVTSDAVQCKY